MLQFPSAIWSSKTIAKIRSIASAAAVSLKIISIGIQLVRKSAAMRSVAALFGTNCMAMLSTLSEKARQREALPRFFGRYVCQCQAFWLKKRGNVKRCRAFSDELCVNAKHFERKSAATLYVAALIRTICVSMLTILNEKHGNALRCRAFSKRTVCQC